MKKLSTQAFQSLAFTETCLLQGMCTPKEYMKATKTIWKDDFEMQKQFMLDVKSKIREEAI